MNDGIAFKTYVKSDDGQTYLIDTIKHEGALWLVPKWLETTNPNMQKPVRIIQMAEGAYRDLGRDFLGTGHHALELTYPIPKAVLDAANRSQPTGRHFVVEGPELWIRR